MVVSSWVHGAGGATALSGEGNRYTVVFLRAAQRFFYAHFLAADPGDRRRDGRMVDVSPGAARSRRCRKGEMPFLRPRASESIVTPLPGLWGEYLKDE